MSDLMSHLDDFTVLRFVAGDLQEPLRSRVADHLQGCSDCLATRNEIEALDRELAALAKEEETRTFLDLEDLPENDPFRRRPPILGRPERGKNRVADARRTVGSSEEGISLAALILDAAKNSSSELSRLMNRLDFSDTAHRFALLYAMQEAGQRIALGPAKFQALARLALKLIRNARSRATEISPAEAIVALVSLEAAAHQLAGHACLWTGEFDKAGTHLIVAFRLHCRCGDDIGIANGYLLESQRRSFTSRGAEALSLALRARVLFELYGLTDYVARTFVAEGLALFDLGRQEEAVEAYRRSIPIFESQRLWSNYVGAVNSVATSLQRLGRLDEARREYARALRRVSRESHQSFVAAIRKGLAEVLFSAGRYREAAISAAQASRLYRECDQLYYQLSASLYEVECWARAGYVDRARHRLSLFRAEASRLGNVDSSISRNIERALAGEAPDFQHVSSLCREATDALEERLGTA